MSTTAAAATRNNGPAAFTLPSVTFADITAICNVPVLRGSAASYLDAIIFVATSFEMTGADVLKASREAILSEAAKVLRGTQSTKGSINIACHKALVGGIAKLHDASQAEVCFACLRDASALFQCGNRSKYTFAPTNA
jgi:hypothetical protein